MFFDYALHHLWDPLSTLSGAAKPQNNFLRACFIDPHFPLNVKVKLKGNFSLICTFLNTYENKLFLIKLKPQNIVIDLRHHV